MSLLTKATDVAANTDARGHNVLARGVGVSVHLANIHVRHVAIRGLHDKLKKQREKTL